MFKNIGIVEFRSIAIGIGAVDTIVKASQVKIIDAKTICAGKYYIIFSGGVSEIKNSINKIIADNDIFIVDYAEIANIYPEIFSAINQTSDIKQLKSIGVIETITSPSILIAADRAVKATDIELVEIRIARALGGKNLCMINGELSAVKESVQEAVKYAKEKDFLVDYSIIASPHEDFYKSII